MSPPLVVSRWPEVAPETTGSTGSPRNSDPSPLAWLAARLQVLSVRVPASQPTVAPAPRGNGALTGAPANSSPGCATSGGLLVAGGRTEAAEFIGSSRIRIRVRWHGLP